MRFLTAFLTTLLVASEAFAHTGVGTTAGFAHGALHPLGGLDHLLAMVTVGLLAFHLGGKAIWLVPASFLAMMVVGGALGVAGVALPLVELGIVLSVVVLGALVAFGRSLPVALAMTLAGGFALFHGHAHGAEMPVAASGLIYGLGFLLSTAALHGAGLLAGFGLEKATASRTLARASGAVASGLGVLLLVGVL